MRSAWLAKGAANAGLVLTLWEPCAFPSRFPEGQDGSSNATRGQHVTDFLINKAPGVFIHDKVPPGSAFGKGVSEPVAYGVLLEDGVLARAGVDVSGNFRNAFNKAP